MSGSPVVAEVRSAPSSETVDLQAELATLLVTALQLEVAPADIEPDAPLFGEGLGLDSIDALELALAISRTYGFELRSDDEQNHRIFASLHTLARHVAAHRVT